MNKTIDKKLSLGKIKIAQLNNTERRDVLTTSPSHEVTCGVCDPVTLTQAEGTY
jgi:hypothetical protein